MFMSQNALIVYFFFIDSCFDLASCTSTRCKCFKLLDFNFTRHLVFIKIDKNLGCSKPYEWRKLTQVSMKNLKVFKNELPGNYHNGPKIFKYKYFE